MRKIFGIFIFFFFLFLPSGVSANEINQFITIVNPVRDTYYTKSVVANLSVQYGIIKENNLPATWLFTYDVLSNPDVVKFAKSMDKNQEWGIFLEVGPALAKEAGVQYHDTGSWHFANAVFLSGYTQDERRRLIDVVFAKFKADFGIYPTSVGSWWSDSFSLSYMKDKYSIAANLTCSDQFMTDGYQIWGQPWETPYYPSRYDNSIPASDGSVKLDVVDIQWAPRDPINGYKSSLFSTQDYKVVNLDFNFFKKLVDLYARKNSNEFGQITIGLEGDLDANAYNGEFSRQIEYARSLQSDGNFSVTNMSQFASWYRQNFPGLSPAHTLRSDDFLGTNKKVIWYQSPRYRVGIVSNADGSDAKIFDLRTYHKSLEEPYYVSPNRQITLSIYTPSYFDEIQNSKDIWDLGASEKDIRFFDNKVVVNKFFWSVPKTLSESKALIVRRFLNRLEIIPKVNWISPLEGVVIKDFSPEAMHFLKQKKAVFELLLGKGWNYFKKVSYLVPQGEMDALFRLSTLLPGKVMVFDNECLQCSWHTEFRPPAFSNRRSYVSEFGKHSITYNSSIFKETDRVRAKGELAKLGIKYIYLVKFEDYVEKLPFSPGDLGIEKIYSNANAEIWEMK